MALKMPLRWLGRLCALGAAVTGILSCLARPVSIGAVMRANQWLDGQVVRHQMTRISPLIPFCASLPGQCSKTARHVQPWSSSSLYPDGHRYGLFCHRVRPTLPPITTGRRPDTDGLGMSSAVFLGCFHLDDTFYLFVTKSNISQLLMQKNFKKCERGIFTYKLISSE